MKKVFLLMMALVVLLLAAGGDFASQMLAQDTHHQPEIRGSKC
jgi:hypothetical protein